MTGLARLLGLAWHAAVAGLALWAGLRWARHAVEAEPAAAGRRED
jgi:hypothetical protein